jgi:hypothetical protein
MVQSAAKPSDRRLDAAGSGPVVGSSNAVQRVASTRANAETLEVTYRGHTIAAVL